MDKRQMSASEIMEKYKQGERDFSNIISRSQNFVNMDLRGANFSHSILDHSSFRGADLQGADFTEADLSWIDLTLADMKGAKFFKANISYALLTDAVVNGVDFRNVDFRWSIAFNVNLESADIRGAHTVGLARSISDITPDYVKHVQGVLDSSKLAIPFQVFLQITHNVDKTKGDFQVVNAASLATKTYGEKTSFGYSGATTSAYASKSNDSYSFQSSGGSSYKGVSSAYKKDSAYGRKK